MKRGVGMRRKWIHLNVSDGMSISISLSTSSTRSINVTLLSLSHPLIQSLFIPILTICPFHTLFRLFTFRLFLLLSNLFITYLNKQQQQIAQLLTQQRQNGGIVASAEIVTTLPVVAFFVPSKERSRISEWIEKFKFKLNCGADS